MFDLTYGRDKILAVHMCPMLTINHHPYRNNKIKKNFHFSIAKRVKKVKLPPELCKNRALHPAVRPAHCKTIYMIKKLLIFITIGT